MINEEKLFKLLPYFFDRPSAVLLEIAQNAHRSGASKLAVTLKGTDLEVEDDGSGADNPRALVCLAESDWPSEVMENQMPASLITFQGDPTQKEEVTSESFMRQISVSGRFYQGLPKRTTR